MVQVIPLRRLAVTALAVCAAVIASSAAGPVSAYAARPGSAGTTAGVPSTAGGRAPLAPPPVREEDRTSGDHLTVTVRHSGGRTDGTFEVYCRPDRGSHPDPGGACGAVDRNTRWGRDVFAPVPGGELCTMRYGGPATAHVTGRWAGRPVDATFDRSNGCQIERWDRFVPLLPGPRPASAAGVAEAPVP
ncbi:SSI family serine proteinase inhibitor [Streptomyces sp. ME08-AFT2]|uniref:SSI family serine proteinase inhibitor n=1 Tax=Streptomyces sp. ME08-AFT2 TaxID=3028683 RepID=UPI0029A45288|nr:SSI family serine proteinase inhibitor [Streptomyces sp. ME08-AFT2]MDX3308970.1 SSI family serine proteinase inhibitor [Streptomyces sp. ME08-AFT2]